MPQPFASISASLLARKGEAKPSQEPAFGSKPWQPPVVPAQQPQPRPPVAPSPAAAASIPMAALTPTAMAPVEAKVKLSEVDSVWPTPPAKPVHAAEVDTSGWEPARPAQPATPVNPNTPIKTTIRLTHAQVRAVKLAALLLDRPQQEILTAGLLGRLEAIACSDLSACTCFKAVMEGLKAPDPLMEPPLPY